MRPPLRGWLRWLGQGSAFGEVAAFVAQLGESDALHAWHEGEFAAVMEVVGDDVPGNPLARERVVLPFVQIRS